MAAIVERAPGIGRRAALRSRSGHERMADWQAPTDCDQCGAFLIVRGDCPRGFTAEAER